MLDKTVEQKEYEFQTMKFKLKRRSLAIRKDTFLMLNEFLKYVKQYSDVADEESINFSLVIYLSDEQKLKELFGRTLDGPVDKISYDAESDEDYSALLTFASKIFTDFFSDTLMSQNKTSGK